MKNIEHCRICGRSEIFIGPAWTNLVTGRNDLQVHDRPLESGLCAECLDSALAAQTGCRFGTPDSCTRKTHTDCWTAH